MATAEAYEAIKKIHQEVNIEETPLFKKLKDSWTQGLTLQRCYESHWDEIKDCIENLDLELRDVTPLMTLNEHRNVITVKDIVNKLYPYVKGDFLVTSDRDIKKRIFISILTAYPIYCKIVGDKTFEKFIIEEENYRKIIKIGGTILERDKRVFEILSE